MISNLNYEEWHRWVPFVAFGLIFGVFAISLVRLCLMKNDQADRAASLPLEAESKSAE